MPFDRLSHPAPGFATGPALVSDAPEIARLFLIASDGLAAYIWGRLAAPGESLEAVGAARYARSGADFSYRNATLATRGADVLGMALAFPAGPDGEPEADPVLRPYSLLNDPGSLYLAGLAVFPGHEGRGIGSALVGRVIDRARALDLPRVSLICFERNARAIAFYRRLGFREAARRPLHPHPSLRYADGDAILMLREA